MDKNAALAQLKSPLYGAMAHAVHVSASVLHADVAAARFFNTSPPALEQSSSLVVANRLSLSHLSIQALQHWPMDQLSVFKHLNTRRPKDGVSRLSKLIKASEPGWDGFFEPVQSIASVVDGYCVSLTPAPSCWYLAVYLRCAPNERFSHAQVDLLNQVYQPLREIVRSGYERQIYALQPARVNATINAPDLLTRLSATERQVLEHLKSGRTEKQIARRASRSRHTIHVHVKNIYRKLNVRSRQQLLDMLQNLSPGDVTP